MRHMVAAAFFFAVMAAFARLAGERVPAQEIVLFRALMATALSVGMARHAGAPLWGRRPVFLALRGLTGFAALSCYFWTVVHLPFALAVLLAQTNPVFTAVFAWAFLGERPGWRLLPAAALVLAGVAALVPSGIAPGGSAAGVAVALVGAALAGSAYTEVRALARTEAPLTIVLWFQGLSLLLAIPGTILEGPVLPRGIEWLWLVGVGATGHLGQVLLTHGLARVPAGRGTLANPLVVAFGAGFGWAIFDEPLGWNVAFGAALLVAGLLLAGMHREPPGVAATAGASAP